MSEKSGYGAQIFILIVAVVLLVSLSRAQNLSNRISKGTVEIKASQQELAYSGSKSSITEAAALKDSEAKETTD